MVPGVGKTRQCSPERTTCGAAQRARSRTKMVCGRGARRGFPSKNVRASQLPESSVKLRFTCIAAHRNRSTTNAGASLETTTSMLLSDELPRVGVLLVDNRHENLEALEVILEPLGQRLVRAGSGAEALRAVLNEQFAVILMDVRMPGLDGFETLGLLKQRERSCHIPIIFLSAFPEQRDVLRGYSAGAVD